MLSLLVVALVGSAVARPQLLPPVFHQPAPVGQAFAPGQRHLLAPASPFAAQPITTVQRTYQADEHGQFTSSHTDSAGSTFQETGHLVPTNDGRDNVLIKSGNFQYVSPEGIPVSLSYTADARGYHPISSSIPIGPLPIQPTF